MATYKQIQEYIKATYGFTVKTCWIAHMKEVCGLKRKDSPNRKDPNKRVYPCPENKKKFIREAFRHFDMI
ncbi:hypothetical protein ACFIJ5_13945 [Haloimpatiens sp. FM7330]|uniref:hypothetical protein n=1 Tax=Haloimpatiens sp. FM7330 TaxID=3298610 RepID=UPI00362F885C